MITVRLEPDCRELQFPKLRTVLQLLHKLGLGQGAVLIIRDGELLTPDRRLAPGDTIIVRRVTSRG
jgi:sulfur carrier protein